ncbi:type I-B CRISPR-associated protein Cas7/Cst2/DevR [Acetobacterium woodii]|uniref:CRISPR-associated regulatory protein DevR family Cst2 n=1 Tax=Acetobacterium woodii (strain ATCC 29683 / DSM 1030 / JCM 2381 / KCTC 1655 / WB1) TaxID=931626 RepID=H6LHF7_ACEWD|nr:type I-B CRISPR-associated protein Cas7/Cst2/DevR [Acetobacterium woodii]AFA49667.1 CRISPR-associated regulatory protein DevR family Cst2 [Acetobacterium woodii DSM 1030]
MKKALTLTVVANMTANYSEGLGNISSVQKVFKNKKVYSIRSRESLKNAIMVQSGLYDDLQTEVDGATQKLVTEKLTAANCKALEGGYMSTKGTTYIRKSSFYLTDAISTDNFVNETRFHNNLYLASTEAKQKGINLQEKSKESGLMPYQYEYDKSLKVYSFTMDLEMVGKDENFNAEATSAEKANRVIAIVEAIENLSLVVKGNLDNAEPVFVIGGLSPRKTHFFENVVRVQGEKLIISDDLLGKLEKGFNCGLLRGNEFLNEEEIVEKLKPQNMTAFFNDIKSEINNWYGV